MVGTGDYLGGVSVKLIVLGTGSAFTLEYYQSNMLIEGAEGRLLIDCGGDVRHSLAAQGLNALDITDVYISHLHTDHIGGLEWLGLVSYFVRTRNDPSAKPRLYLHQSLVEDLWHSLHGGMGTIEGHVADLSTYFDLRPIGRNGCFTFSGSEFQTVQVVHYYDGYEIVPTYALLFECNAITVFITFSAGQSLNSEFPVNKMSISYTAIWNAFNAKLQFKN